jgi:hypothetical protein
VFNAPNIVTQIPDIAQIYAINEDQGEQLDADVEQINNDIFVDSMGDDTLKHWESIFRFTPKDDASLDDRRLKVKGKMIERLPYSYNVMISKLNSMLPYGYDLYLNEDLTYMQVKVNLISKYTLPDVQEFLEAITPLNMFLEVILKYNTYGVLNQFTHGTLGSYTYGQLVDEPIS